MSALNGALQQIQLPLDRGSVCLCGFFKGAFSLAAICRNCFGWLKPQRWSNLISFSSTTRPGLSGVWKNVMVMYKNTVVFSNVTGNMVLAESSARRIVPKPRKAVERDGPSWTKLLHFRSYRFSSDETEYFSFLLFKCKSRLVSSQTMQADFEATNIPSPDPRPDAARPGSEWQRAELGRPPQKEPGSPHLDK